MSLLAIDIGSSACKAVVFANSGAILAHSAAEYRAEFPQPGFAEMDPQYFWNAVCSSSRAAARELRDPVQAVCISSHGETFVPVNSAGDPVGAAILNQDTRAAREASAWEENLGRKRLFEITGLVAHPMYPIFKILWLRQHRPQTFSSTERFVSLIGYILQRLGLPPYVDYSLASRFLAFDIRKRKWSKEILGAVGLSESCLPLVVPTGTVVGKLDVSIASELGLKAGTGVVLGGHDQPCAALGLGVTGQGRVSDSMGTYECVVAASDAPSLDDRALNSSLNSYCHVIPGKFVTLAFFPSGIMVKWFHDLLYANETKSCDSDRTDADHYSCLESRVSPSPSGLCITPHLIGTCNPDFNPRVRGIIAGLTAETERSQIYKGILEGLACELSLITGNLAEAVGEFQDIYVTGGGSRSQLGLRLRAALTGRRLHMTRCPEAVCLGSAILAGVATGEYASIDEAVRQVVHETGVVEPESKLAASYAGQLIQYRRLRALAGEFYRC
jgi:xylulokinase